MSLTRLDFVEIAKQLKETRPNVSIETPVGRASLAMHAACCLAVSMAISRRLRDQNAGFDTDRFLKDCDATEYLEREFGFRR